MGPVRAPSGNGEAGGLADTPGVLSMKLPVLDLFQLPDLDVLTGLFGSVTFQLPGHDDTIVVIATVVYEATGG